MIPMEFPSGMMNTTRNTDLSQRIIKVSRILQDVEPDKVTVLCHADHDGFTSSALFDAHFLQEYGKRTKIIYPHKYRYYSLIFQELVEEKPQYLLILDALVAKHARLLKKLAENGSLIVNMDHHDIVELSDRNYVSLNPHECGIEYLNSSGLAWLVLRNIDRNFSETRAWVAGIGAAQDLCLDDNELLFDALHSLGLLGNRDYATLFDSKLMRIAKMINAACNEERYDYTYSKILQATRVNSIEILLEDEELSRSFDRNLKTFEETYDDFERRHEQYDDLNLIAYEFTREMKTSSIAEICEKHRRPCVYVGYHRGKLGFCSLFYDCDVRDLARRFGGNGPHPRIAAGRTRKAFKDVLGQIRRVLKSKKTQQQMDSFLERS